MIREEEEEDDEKSLNGRINLNVDFVLCYCITDTPCED